MSAVYAAQYRADLDELMIDLPAAVVPSTRPARSSERYWRSRQWGAWSMTAAICLLIWGLTSLGDLRPHYFWPFWVIGPWGAVIAWRLIFGSRCAR